ncbi:hypothetical protein F750_1076 [Streptomyces sp. PAMC 26508]|nr:hypothetical protein F750_1076 [Streptomyces sp. PAMC 26508]
MFEAEREDPRAPPTLPLRGPPDCRGRVSFGRRRRAPRQR